MTEFWEELMYSNYSYNFSFSDIRQAWYFRFIFCAIIIPIIIFFGLLGNTLTIFVLFRREMRSSTVLYLRALVITDSSILLVLITVVTPWSIVEILEKPSYYKNVVYPLTFIYGYYAVWVMRMCNVWITVSVSVERYIAICHPYAASRITTTRNTLIVIVFVAVFSIASNLPRFFAMAPRPCLSGNADCYELHVTDFGNGYGYWFVYRTWAYSIVVFIVPLAALFLLNIRIIVELMRIAKRRRVTLRVSNQSHDQVNVSFVLILVVAVFIICQTPYLIAQFEIFSNSALLKFGAVCNTMLALNSSVNFLIYAFVGRKFRKVFIKTVCHRCVDIKTSHVGEQRIYI